MAKINQNSEWAQASSLRKRLSGCFGYLLVALGALIAPVITDMAMYAVLREQFEDEDDGH